MERAALAQAVWSGLSIFVGFIWGVYVFHEPVHSQITAYASLIIMALGIGGVAWAASIPNTVRPLGEPLPYFS